MIENFKDDTSRDIYDGLNSKAARKIPQDIWPAARRKLDMLNAAQELKDLKSPPGNKLEALTGNLNGQYSIRINEQYRVVFKFEDGHATQVRINDYH